jgi:hypothetical protein
MTRQWWLAIGVVAIFAVVFLTSGFARWSCARCWDQRSTFDLFTVPIFDVEPHYDEFGMVEMWERVHGKPCSNVWKRGSVSPLTLGSRFFPRLHFEAAVVQDRVAAEALMLTKTPQELNQQDALGRTPMHWIAAASGIGPMREQVLARGVRLDVRDEDGLTPLDWDWRARAKTAPR